MFRRNDPRFQRTLNELSHTFENANQTAQTQVWVLGQEYISPCLASIRSGFQSCMQPCFGLRDQRTRRPARRANGRPELNFDFYDDWDDDEEDALLGFGDDDFPAVGSAHVSYGGTAMGQPGLQPGMSYATRRDVRESDAGGAGSSYFGFFRNMKDKLGAKKALRYKPSAAGLQDHPGASHFTDDEQEPLMSDDGRGHASRKQKQRKRSATTGSGHTSDSFSSRGDIFPSDDEDDAVALDDEFAMVLERRTTNSATDDASSTGDKHGTRPGLGSRRSTRTRSARSTPRSHRSSRAASHGSPPRPGLDDDPEPSIIPTLNELKQEEEQTRLEEEAAIEQRRQAAQRLAIEKGLVDADVVTVGRHDAFCVLEQTTNTNQVVEAPPDQDQAGTSSHDDGPLSGSDKHEMSMSTLSAAATESIPRAIEVNELNEDDFGDDHESSSHPNRHFRNEQ